MNRCLVCGKNVPQGRAYHERCCRQLFERSTPPELPYRFDDLNSLAEKVVRSSTVVTGVQPKISLHLEHPEQKGERLTLVGWQGRFILKPPVPRFPYMPELEHLSMLLAQCFGIDTVPFGLVALQSGEFALITRRIDRINHHKLHMEDLCQLSDKLTEQKYRASLELAGKNILKYSSHPLLDALRFFEVNLYSFLIGNADMHLKNFSLLHQSDGLVVLAPAYDLLSTRILLPEDHEESALTINGRKNRIQPDDFLILGQRLRLNPKQLSNVFKRFERNLQPALHQISRGFVPDEMKKQLHKLMCQRAERLFGSR